jgi:hypothetical protein
VSQSAVTLDNHVHQVRRDSSQRSNVQVQRTTLVHAVETDDPVGTERYRHRRLADRNSICECLSFTPTT